MIHDLHFSILDFFSNISPGVGIQDPTDREFQEKCNSSWGSYCQATHGGYSCPIECTGDQTLGGEKGQGRCPFFSAKIGWFNVNTMVRYG